MWEQLIISLLSVVLLIIAVTGCDRIQGAGEDIESAGQAIAGEYGTT